MVGPLAYLGGKNRVAQKIISLIPEHTCYIEPFCGGAQVFFHKEPSQVEILNDLDEEVFNFLRVCQLHNQELVRYLEFCIVSRKWFELFQKQDPKTLSDIQRAARFFYLQKNCYGGLINRKNFAVSVQDGSNYNPHRIPMVLHLAHERLLQVQLECLPYQEILKRYDRPTTFFYLDPPYFDRPYYKFNFEEKNYIELAALLKELQGRFLLSLNDTPEIRDIFAEFKIHGLTFSYSSQRKAGKLYKEVLISNYSLPIATVDQRTPANSPAGPNSGSEHLKNPEAASGHQNIESAKSDVEKRAADGDGSPEHGAGNRAA
jgi:DNA adenine methylase